MNNQTNSMASTTDGPMRDFPKENLYEALKFQTWRYLDYEKSKAIPMNMLVMHEFKKIDSHVFSKAVDTMVERHESLRTLFTKQKGVVYQCICERQDFPSNVQFVDISEKKNSMDLLETMIHEMNEYVFDFQNEQAFKCSCVKVSKDTYVLMFVIDHMISDGHSRPIIIKELNALYSAYATGMSNPLPPQTAQLKDYSRYHNQHYNGELKADHESYYKWLFSDLPPRLKINPGLLPIEDDSSVNIDTPEGRYKFFMPESALIRIKSLTSEMKMTFFNFMLVGFCWFLSRISEQKEFFVDSPATTRNAEFQNIIGWLVGPLVSRMEVDDQLSFRDLLFQCKQIISEGLDHIYFNTYSDLLDEEWNEVVSTQLNVLNSMHSPLKVVPELVGHAAMESFVFDFTFNIQIYQYQILVDCLYKPEFIKNTQIAGLCSYFNTMIECALAEPDRPLKDLIN